MLEPLVVVLVAILVLGALCRRFGLVEPPILLLGGLAIGLVPHIKDVELAPELILTIVLPALLYWEALTTSLREVRANLRVIVLLAVGLVLFTTPVVAWALHEFNDTDWPTAFIIGAVLAPTDAAAVAAIAYMLPRRFMTMLRAESLINDGTALVLVAAAVDVAVGGERVHWGSIWLDLVLSYAGGIAIGVAVAGVVILVRRYLHDPMLGTVLSVATPFVAFLPAEELRVSGVLAVVVCGLTVAALRPAAHLGREQVAHVLVLGTHDLPAQRRPVRARRHRAPQGHRGPGVPHPARRDPGGGSRDARRRAEPDHLVLHLHDPDPHDRPTPVAACPPGRQPAPRADDVGRRTRRHLTRRSPRRAVDDRRGSTVPRARLHHLRDRRDRAADPRRPGHDVATRHPLGPLRPRRRGRARARPRPPRADRRLVGPARARPRRRRRTSRR